MKRQVTTAPITPGADRRRRRRRVRFRAFTLIELLVVISIIALLIGILLPALSAARKVARNAVCLSNLRQVGIGFNSYAAENESFLPAPSYIPSGTDIEIWQAAIYEYVAGELDSQFKTALAEQSYLYDTAFICPQATNLEANQKSAIQLSYAMNFDLPGRLPRDSIATSFWNEYKKLDLVETASDTLIASDGSTWAVGHSNKGNKNTMLVGAGVGESSLFTPQSIVFDYVTNILGRKEQRHGDYLNIAMVDGSAASELWARDEESVPYVPVSGTPATYNDPATWPKEVKLFWMGRLRDLPSQTEYGNSLWLPPRYW